MNNLDFINLAVSKDTNRMSIGAAYRDLTSLVATDGYRVHWIDGQPPIEKGYYLDGRDFDFPKWKQVIPNKSPEAVGEYYLSKNEIKTLKALIKLYKSVRKEPGVLIELKNGKLFISYTYKELSASFNFNTLRCTKPFDVYLNGEHVLDAIELALKKCISCPITIEFYGKGMIVIFKTCIGNAGIMPMRM